jgi:hypothetical protein
MKKTLGAVILLTSALLAAAVAPVNAKAADASKMKLVGATKYDGGGELAASGRFIYSGEANAVGGGGRGSAPEDGGLHIYDTKKKKEVGFLHCAGTDNDIEVIRRGYVAMGFTQNKCSPTTGEGIMIIDVRNAAKPKPIAHLTTNAAHTMKPFPGGKYLYMGGGNLAGSADRAGLTIVDVSNPKKPKIAKTIPSTQVMDCHDVSFSISKKKKLAFCAGAIGTGETQIWDVSDPLNPTVLSRIVNPAIQYSHYGVANKKQTLLAIDDEAFAAHDCNSGQSPTGRVWLYDISNPQAPLPQGSFAPPGGRGGNPAMAGIGNYAGWVGSWCLSHGLDWHPKKDMIAVTWFTAGVSVLDASDPLTLSEYAYYDTPDNAVYSTLWHDGYLATNDHMKGFELFKVKGL